MSIYETNKLNRFASIREAKWAKFFNSLKCKFEYRPVVYLGERYTASFFLPDINLIAFTTPYNKNSQAFQNLFDIDFPGVRYTYLGDIPDPEEEEELYSFDVYGKGMEDFNYAFCVCPVCRRVGFEYMGRGARVCEKCCGDDDKGYTYNAPEILDALKFARDGFEPWEIEEFSEHQKITQCQHPENT